MRIDTVVGRDLFPDGVRAGESVPLRIGDLVFGVDVAAVTAEGEHLRLSLDVVDAEVTPWGHPVVPRHPRGVSADAATYLAR